MKTMQDRIDGRAGDADDGRQDKESHYGNVDPSGACVEGGCEGRCVIGHLRLVDVLTRVKDRSAEVEIHPFKRKPDQSRRRPRNSRQPRIDADASR
jgi:hypothetical protein